MTRILFALFFLIPSFCLGQEDVQELIKRLSDKEISNREEAARKLGEMEKKAIPAIPALIDALSKNEKGLINGTEISDERLIWACSGVRAAAAKALGKIGVQSEDVVHCLTNALSDVDLDVIFLSVISLGEIGDKASPACPKLIALFGSGELREFRTPITREAHKSLIKIGEKAIPFLIVALENRDQRVVAYSLSVLQALSHKTKIVRTNQGIPILIKIFREGRIYREWYKRIGLKVYFSLNLDAALILSKMGDKPVPSLLHVFAQEGFQLSPNFPGLCDEEMVSEKEEQERKRTGDIQTPKIYATDILIKIGKPALPRLEEALHEEQFAKVHKDLEKLILYIKKSLYPEYLYLTWEGTEFVFHRKEIPHLLDLFLEKGGDEKSLYAAALLAFARESLPYLEKALGEEKYAKIHPQIRGIIKKIKAKEKRR